MIEICLGLLFVTLCFLFVKTKFSYWSKHGVPYVHPTFPFGNIRELGNKYHFSEMMQSFYEKLKGKGSFGGIYFFTSPAAIITDVDLARSILFKDFHYFHDRGIYYNEKDDPLSATLLSIEGTRWKSMKEKLITTFSSTKMKMIFPSILQVCWQMMECLETIIENQKNADIAMKDILSRYTTDIIGTCAFGFDCNSLNNQDGEFQTMGNKAFEIPPLSFFKMILMSQFPKISRVMHLKVYPDEITDYFRNFVQNSVDQREKNNTQRCDFLDSFIQLKDTAQITNDEIAAQLFSFFLAGFETSSTTLSYCLYELSMHQTIQDKARESVQDAIQTHGGLTYEAIQAMDYLEKCVRETLRMHPPGASVIRSVTKDYPVPGTKFVLEKGLLVFIPTYAIQNDPDFFWNPEEFIPERFMTEEIAKRHPFSFLPFGEGSRQCIGKKFAMLQITVGLAVLLINYRFKPCPRSITPIQISKQNYTLSPEGGVWMNVEKLFLQ